MHSLALVFFIISLRNFFILDSNEKIVYKETICPPLFMNNFFVSNKTQCLIIKCFMSKAKQILRKDPSPGQMCGESQELQGLRKSIAGSFWCWRLQLTRA